jgi:DNA ligase 1
MLTNLLNEIRDTRGTNAKKELIRLNKSKTSFLKFLDYALNPYMPFHVVKIPKTKRREVHLLTEIEVWDQFFETAKQCSLRSITGNAAIAALSEVFHCATPDQEKWMRKVLKKHLAIGVSEKTVNSVIPGHIPTFDVALAQKFEAKRMKGELIAIEPKLDGIRCFGIVKNGQTMLYARSGKIISNFDNTIGRELSSMGDGCYDGEIMGEDFTSLMRQVYRKESVDTTGTYFGVFDYLPLHEWLTKEATMSCASRYKQLFRKIVGHTSTDIKPLFIWNHIRLVNRSYIKPDEELIKGFHDRFVSEGYEGAMIKDPYAPYKFGRGWEVMKYKAFHDVDLPIKQLLEGTGKHSGKLGSVVVCYKGVDVQVGSGFSDAYRVQIWNEPDTYVGRTIEVRYQEETPDGSLRFPTFVCFRNDK